VRQSAVGNWQLASALGDMTRRKQRILDVQKGNVFFSGEHIHSANFVGKPQMDRVAVKLNGLGTYKISQVS
jgi:hypothetical protein